MPAMKPTLLKLTLLALVLMGTLATAPAEDQILDSVLAEGNKVTIHVKVGGRSEKVEFEFPEAISDYRVIPFMQGSSVVIAAKPREPGDWFWGIAPLGNGAPATSTVARWTSSPPHDAKLLAVENPEGDSFVVHAASFKRDQSGGNAIRAFAYVNHCPASLDGRDIVGHLYSGEIGGPMALPGIEPAGGRSPAARPEPE